MVWNPLAHFIFLIYSGFRPATIAGDRRRVLARSSGMPARVSSDSDLPLDQEHRLTDAFPRCESQRTHGPVWAGLKNYILNRHSFLIILVQRRHSTRTHTHPYEHTYANPTPMSTFEGLSRQILKFTKSPQTPRCRGARRLPLNA